MTKTLLVMMAILCTVALRAQNVYYVAEGATGDGSSWTNATGSISEAINHAVAGGQIWVAEGSYFKGMLSIATTPIYLKDGVSLYGGFAGTETTLAQRQPGLHPSLILGVGGSNGGTDIIIAQDITTETVIDGFTLTS